MKFFAKQVGLKSDIERHRKKEQEIREAIAKLSNKQNSDDEFMDDVFINAYEHSLDILLQSKLKLVNKIGRK